MGGPGVSLSIAATAQDLLGRLFPICRSITGDGVRESLAILGDIAPWTMREYASGTPVYDWTVPQEWTIRDAWIADADGHRVVDFRANNLHVVSYSRPVRARMTFAELRPYLHTLPNLPDAIPYRTSYYKENWGFCLSQNQLEQLNPDGDYEVVIDSELKPGALSLADCVLPGRSGREFLVSTYCCHPSMANDNLSGPIVTTLLLRALAARPERRHSWRFVVLPETIGAITYLATHEAEMKAAAGGFVVTTCGGPGPVGVKQSFLGDHLVDRAVRLALRDAGITPVTYPFIPDGSDERQYSSPGFRIPVTTISKDKYYEYPYYHTSLDNLDFVTGTALAESYGHYLAAIDIIESNVVFRSLNPHCEVQLGRRGLYPQTGGALNQMANTARTSAVENEVDIISWVMFLADGGHDLIAMAERSGFPYRDVAAVASKLETHGLLERLP
jgi:aminopeptidase-like protein